MSWTNIIDYWLCKSHIVRKVQGKKGCGALSCQKENSRIEWHNSTHSIEDRMKTWAMKRLFTLTLTETDWTPFQNSLTDFFSPNLGLYSFGNVITNTTNNTVSQMESTSDHTVIPLAITIKRLSEIYFKKANEYTAKVETFQILLFYSKEQT